MTEQRFNCTQCGKCCFGWVPLTINEALANAGRFPLAMVWTPVRKTDGAHELTTQIGLSLPLGNRKHVAVLISPTAYLPASFACPALAPDKLCSIHENKPLRCRTMPFYPYHKEAAQAEFLTPRQGWLCETEAPAPVVYRDKRILERMNFDREIAALRGDAPLLCAYGETVMKQNPAMKAFVVKSAQTSSVGRTIMNFSSFLRLDKRYDLIRFAQQQHPILTEFAHRTKEIPDLAAYHKFYQDSAAELEWFVRRGDASLSGA
ncbi:MAG: YkgJ family cysteine cluster protein [Alphaproteobacteria bacterium]|nr:YkgJ family cysteine cluster protein [Alphaproteobacteria bacterium]